MPALAQRLCQAPLGILDQARVWDAGGWDPEGYVLSSRDDKPVRVRGSASLDEDSSCSSAITGQPLLVRGQANGTASQQAAGCYMLPMEFSATTEEPVVRTALVM